MPFRATLQALLKGVVSFSGNETGTSQIVSQVASDGSDAPSGTQFTAGGGYQGFFTAAASAGTLLNLADATNIVKSGGTASSGPIHAAQGYAISGSKRLRALYFKNTDPAHTVT